MLPKFIKPMLAAKTEAPFDSEQCSFEIKWDGIRCLAFIEGELVRLQSRHATEMTSHFPELACLNQLPPGTVLDGELVVFECGKPSLQKIQQRALLHNRVRLQLLRRAMPVTYMVFDLLYSKAKPLIWEPLMVRRQALKELIGQTPLPGVLVSQGVLKDGCRLFAHVVRLGLEGVMAKRLDAPYLPGKRSRSWQKIKPRPTAQMLHASLAMAGRL